MNPLRVLKYQLYLLQLENYELDRYWNLLSQKGFYRSRQGLRKDLVWTKKILFILGLSFSLIGIVGFILFIINPLFFIGFILCSLLLLPVYFSLVVLMSLPLDRIAKGYYVEKAKKAIKSDKKLKIIGIAGSYGKTTMKNVIAAVLSSKFKVLVTPDSVNTPIGIAQWFLRNYDNKTEVLIIEMGEHYKGDIKEICELAAPDFTVITGVNEAHLERLKTIDTAIETVFEAVQYSKPDAKIILNEDDKNVKKSYKNYVINKEVYLYSKERVKESKFNAEELSWQFELEGIGKTFVTMLGEYIMGDIQAAVYIGNSLNEPKEAISRGIKTVSPITHRLEPIKSPGNILVIDDSYNGNPDGVSEAIKVLGRFDKRRRLFITPGIVETGEKNREVHIKIGEELAGVADKVLLIRNSATPYIQEGLLNKKFIQDNIIWFETAEVAHTSLGGILKPNDVILFQNDWGDQYL